MESTVGPIDLEQIGQLLRAAKKLAREYRRITGKPLGITGEVAEYEAATLLGLRLCKARQAGYDAERTDSGRKLQIKGRCVSSQVKTGQRLGRIRLDHDWDEVLLVLLDENLEPIEIRSALRPDIESALHTPGSKARNERGQLSIGRFKAISQLVWRVSDIASAQATSCSTVPPQSRERLEQLGRIGGQQ